MSISDSQQIREREQRRLKAWARTSGMAFAMVTALSMAYSAEWKFRMVLADPLAWMTMLVAVAAGLVCGYAVGVRLKAPAAG